VIQKPFEEYLEFRRSTQGPIDDVPLPRSGVKRTEMATEHFSDPQPEALISLADVPRSPTDGLPGFCYQDILNAIARNTPDRSDGEDSEYDSPFGFRGLGYNGPGHLCY